MGQEVPLTVVVQLVQQSFKSAKRNFRINSKKFDFSHMSSMVWRVTNKKQQSIASEKESEREEDDKIG